MIDLRLWRAALLPVPLVLLIAMFSLQETPRALEPPLPPDGFDGEAALTLAQELAAAGESPAPGSEQDAALADAVVERFEELGVGELSEQRWSESVEGDEVELRNVIMVIPGQSERQIALLAPRDAAAGPGVAVYATGLTAVLIDLSDRVSARLPWFIAAVIAISMVLLAVEFRSILVPVKAAILNVLSIGAAYGVVVAVFQWGWGRELLGVHEAVAIEAWVPLMMFAILFGLSMDYEVFLLSRVREEWLESGDGHQSVTVGLAATARVISAAALIMASVFLAFVTTDQVVVKMLGVGLATAVLVDATLVRLVLVPSTMVLLGDANWWLPRPFSRWSGRPAAPPAPAPVDPS